MQNTDPLANLQPLRQPPDPGWWPPAPGWWVLATLILLLLCFAGWRMWQRHARRRYRRAALAELERLQASWPAEDPTGFGSQCNRLLKAVALRSFPRQQVAALNGEPWSDFLNSSVKHGKGRPGALFEPAFDEHLYRPDSENAPGHRDNLYRAARHWIDKHEAQL